MDRRLNIKANGQEICPMDLKSNFDNKKHSSHLLRQILNGNKHGNAKYTHPDFFY